MEARLPTRVKPIVPCVVARGPYLSTGVAFALPALVGKRMVLVDLVVSCLTRAIYFRKGHVLESIGHGACFDRTWR